MWKGLFLPSRRNVMAIELRDLVELVNAENDNDPGVQERILLAAMLNMQDD